jgi:hypothetical protein
MANLLISRSPWGDGLLLNESFYSLPKISEGNQINRMVATPACPVNKTPAESTPITSVIHHHDRRRPGNRESDLAELAGPYRGRRAS